MTLNNLLNVLVPLTLILFFGWRAFANYRHWKTRVQGNTPNYPIKEIERLMSLDMVIFYLLLIAATVVMCGLVLMTA